MTLYELAVVAVPLLAISLVLDPRPVRSAAATERRRRRWFLEGLLTVTLAAVAVILSALVELDLLKPSAAVETVVATTLCAAMLLLCWFSARQMLRPATSVAVQGPRSKAGRQESGGARATTAFVGLTAFVALCFGLALVATS